MFDEQAIHQILHPPGTSYDPEQQLMCNCNGDHDFPYSARYASYVIALKQEAYYERAIGILNRLLPLQDADESSRTYGLWSYTLEEPLSKMRHADFNVAEFIAKTFLDILYRNPQVLTPALKEALIQGLRRAIECGIRRNIAPNCTNISIISCMNIVSAGELLGDARYFSIGKQRLQKLLAYTRFTTGFTEYNSSNYGLLDIEESTRMLDFFKDPECRSLALELNTYAWHELTTHFNTAIGQLSPPQSRAYIDLEKGSIQALIYLGTGGRFGRIESPAAVAPPWLIVGLKCPESCIRNLQQAERWLDHRYFRRNDIISPNELGADANDSPDLFARTYMTPAYSMGSFSVCDLWNQRRTCMLLWGKEHPCFLRLHGLRDGRDFSSAMSYASQYKNMILGHVGFVTGRGSEHISNDLNKSGVFDAETLGFRFELGGNPNRVNVRQEGNVFFFDSDDVRIRLAVWAWFYDGKPGTVRLDKKTKCVELVCFEGARRTFDLMNMEKSYGVFTIEAQPQTLYIPEITVENDTVVSRLSTDRTVLQVGSSTLSLPFEKAAELSARLAPDAGDIMTD